MSNIDWMEGAREPSVYRPSTSTTARPTPRAADGFGVQAPNTREENSRRSQVFRGPAPAVSSAANPIIQRVSRMGVDPRSPQGQQIIDLLSQGYDESDPMISQMIGDLVAEYQDTLIGPLTKNTQPAPGDAMGPFFDREGNQFGYTSGDAFAELDKLSTENLARIQGRLVGLGLLDSYVPGRKDGDTQKAFGWLLQMANSSGHDWARELSSLEQIKAEDPESWEDRMGGGSGSGREGPAPFVEPAYLAPDYATLAQRVKEQLRGELGRDPDESEMALLTAELSGWDREAFQAEVDAQRAEYEATVAAGEGAEGQSGGTVQGVDPLARFKESFDQKFKAELRGIERREEVEDSQALTTGAVSTLSQMSGGMG